MAKGCAICASVKKPKDDVNFVQRKRNLGLLTASYVGHIKCMNNFITEGAGVNCADEKFDSSWRRKLCKQVGFTLGSLYVNVVHEQLIRFTPLICAAANGHLKCVEILVEKGADVNLVSDGRTALGAAAEKGQHKCLQRLIELGGSVNHTDSTIRPALMCVNLGLNKNTLQHKKCIEVLTKAGADVNIDYPFGDETITPLADTVKYGAPENLTVLIKTGAGVNMGRGRYLPLYTAALDGKFKAAKVLIDAGADVNKRNDYCETPLHTSLTFFSQGCFNLLMKQGADVNIASNKGVTPLMRAARSCRYFQMMMNRQESVADIKAEKVRSIRRIGRLLKAGVQINRLDHLGRNTLQFSIEGNQRNVKEINMLLYAAGETLDEPTVPTDSGTVQVNIPDYLKELRENLDLKHLCREAIRKHLIDLDPHEHLFGRMPQLGLPSLVMEYLLYDCSLDYRRAADCENNTEPQAGTSGTFCHVSSVSHFF